MSRLGRARARLALLVLVILAGMLTTLGACRLLGDGRSSSPANSLLAAAPVGSNPSAVAVDPLTVRVFVLSLGSLDGLHHPVGPGGVAVLDERSGARVRTSEVGTDPNAVAIDQQLGRVFVASAGPFNLSGHQPTAGRLDVLDARSGRVLQTVAVGSAPHAVAVDQATEQVVVVSRGVPPGPGSVSILDARRGSALGQLQVGVYPADVAVDSLRGRAFVANFVSNTVSVLDLRTRQVIAEIRLSAEPGTVAHLVADEQTARVFALSFPPRVSGGDRQEAGSVQVLDADGLAVLRTVPLPNPVAMALDAERNEILIGSAGSQGGQVTAIEAHDGTVEWTAGVAGQLTAIGVDEAGGRIFVADPQSTALAVLDSANGRTRCTIALSERPSAVVVDQRSRRVVVPGAVSDKVVGHAVCSRVCKHHASSIP